MRSLRLLFRDRAERYLHYTMYASGRAGLSNLMMSAEIACVLAALSRRTLVLAGNTAPTANVVDYGRPLADTHSRVTDLVELPVPWLDATDVDLAGDATRELSDRELMYGVLVHPSGLDVTTEDFASFARGRDILTLDGPNADVPVLEVSGGPPVGEEKAMLGNLAFYSYFFYLDEPSRATMFDALRAMKPREELAEFAAMVAAELGSFNAVHIRRGDFKATYGVTTLDRTPDQALEVMEQHFDPRDPLVIVTDEMGDRFFDGIFLRYRNAVFMDEIILERFGEELQQLPRRDPIAIAFLSQLIAAESRDFIGTMTSTYTSMIQRYRGNRGKHEPFKFLWNEIPDEDDEVERGRHRFSDCVPLRAGVMVEEYDGPYSWNRVNQRINPAWQREWPESFLPARVATARGRRGLRRKPRVERFYSLVCTDAYPGAQWQTEFLEHTWASAGQPGELVRLFAAGLDTPLPKHAHARVVRTSPANRDPVTDDEYMPYNRLFSIAEWLERERPEGTVILLDCDQVFRSPISTPAPPRRPAAQEWHGFNLDGDAGEATDALSPGTRGAVQPVTWPARIHTSDLEMLIPRWIELTRGFRQRLGAWESDMFAFAVASAELGIVYELETIAAFMNWPEEFVAGAPIVHYCQPVETPDGATLFWKHDYEPWEPLAVDPDSASLDYCRDLLRMLQSFIETKRPDSRAASSTEPTPQGESAPREPDLGELTPAEQAGRAARAGGDRRIFVQIASYRDSELPATIASALEAAAEPELLRFGICWQTDGQDERELAEYMKDDRFRIERVDHRESRGTCWARSRVNALYDGEPYTLQIDAHSRFAREWDRRFIEMLDACRVEKPLLTTYPPSYQLLTGGGVEFDTTAGIQRLRLERIERNLTTRQGGEIVPDESRPGPSALFGAGLVFTHGELCADVPYDPDLYFNGEEIVMAVRAFTHGYTLLYPSENLVWHRYQHREPKHWEDHDDFERHEERALARLRALLLEEPDPADLFGLGSRRTREEFERYSGIDFAAAANPAQGDVVHFRTELELDVDGLEERDDEFWVFVLLDDEGELYRSDIVDPEVMSCRRRVVGIDADLARRPTKYLLWPKAKDGTWGERRVLRLPSAVGDD